MGNKRKKRDVETIRETVLATREGKKQKKPKKQTTTESNKLKHKEDALNKRIDELSNHLKEITEIVKKLEKNSDLVANSVKNLPPVVEHDCCFESENSNLASPDSIFVSGFDCSFPREDALNKRIDELTNHLKEITQIVKKLEKNSELVAISVKEKETPPVVEYDCCYESENSNLAGPNSIFVSGFDCSFPRKDIKSALIKHFSSCVTVLSVYFPFHCESGRPVGHAFLNVSKSEVNKALALDKSNFGGKRLLVVLAIDSHKYGYGEKYHKICKRCRPAWYRRSVKSFHAQQIFIIDLKPIANKDDERN